MRHAKIIAVLFFAVIYLCMACTKEQQPTLPDLFVNVGPDISLDQPAAQALLQASFTMSNTATSRWEKLSGPFCVIETPSRPSTIVSQLQIGVYLFQFTAITSSGRSASDSITVTVKEATITIDYIDLDSAYTVISLPQNSASIEAVPRSFRGVPNNITAVLWEKISGPPSYQIESPQALRTSIFNLQEGLYKFRCSISTRSGAVSTALAAIAVADPLALTQEIILSDQDWIIDQTGFGFNYLVINIPQYVPVGIAIRKVFLRPDCFTEWKQLTLANYPWMYDWAYAINDGGNSLQIIQPYQYSCGADRPDVKIVY